MRIDDDGEAKNATAPCLLHLILIPSRRSLEQEDA
jgi:hypothetical protein